MGNTFVFHTYFDPNVGGGDRRPPIKCEPSCWGVVQAQFLIDLDPRIGSTLGNMNKLANTLMCFNINLLNLILIPPRSVDLQARHRQPLVNEKPLVIHQRKGLEVQYHLRNDAHMGGLSSWVSVDPVHWRLGDIRQDLNNRNTKMKNKPHSSSPCSEKEDDPCLTSHRRSALQSSPSHRTPSSPPWPRPPP